MRDEIFKKVFIHSESDLPEVTGVYFAFIKDDQEIQQWTYNKGSDTDDSIDWLNNVDWYLLPLSDKEPAKNVKTAEEIFNKFCTLINTNYSDYIIKDKKGFIKAIASQSSRSVISYEMTEKKRIDFCLWYYAQSQPLDANKVFGWFHSQFSGQPVSDEMISIPKWQMVHIEDTLRMANNIHHSGNKETCFDRCVCKAWDWSKKSLNK